MSPEHQFNREIVIITPIDPKGDRIVAFVEPDGTEQSYCYVEVGGERLRIDCGGALIERWKADHLTSSQQYMHTLSHEDLINQGVEEGSPTYLKRIGALTKSPMFAVRQPLRSEILAAVAPVDEDAIRKVVASNPQYQFVEEQFGTAIRASLRTGEAQDIESLYAGFLAVTHIPVSKED